VYCSRNFQAHQKIELNSRAVDLTTFLNQFVSVTNLTFFEENEMFHAESKRPSRCFETIRNPRNFHSIFQTLHDSDDDSIFKNLKSFQPEQQNYPVIILQLFSPLLTCRCGKVSRPRKRNQSKKMKKNENFEGSLIKLPVWPWAEHYQTAI
jgi:hypothetical protein